ncbi:MAG: hypothetical protein N2201_03015 [candidate division WOR-3 bacterium]|nr:hypothetical protein [candidate division WOR-3 bacterium]
MQFTDINHSQIPAGVYNGDFAYRNFTFEIELTVKNHEIENFKAVIKLQP